ncbi:hypothetical protein [Candidatus Electronema sp. JC]|uniref:hypothetical protein n=1 Tax=Candidatus Electronema sp. JC TaxID=3401570 RepID=UPI003AA824B0
MKFQCGTCGKYYLIENAEEIGSKQMLRCVDCGNVFALHKNLAFSSSSRNSKLLCKRCGSLIDEAGGTCSVCNPALKSLREEFMIDNREYEFFEVRKGKVRPKGRAGRRSKAALLAGAAVLVIVFVVLAAALLPGSRRDALKTAVLKPLGITSKAETQVVILRSGQTYYAEKVEHLAGTAKITEKSGGVVAVAEKDIAQIAKAVTEE